MAKTATGLVLRAKTVDVVQLRRRGLSGVRIARAASAPIPGPEDAEVVGAIRAVLESAGIKETAVGVAVPAEEVLVRSFTTLLVPKAERTTAVQFEAEKYLPFKTAELMWDFHVEEDRASKRMQVVFVGIRAEWLERLNGWLKEAGLTPQCLEAPACGLGRAVSLASRAQRSKARQEWVAAADIEEDVAHLVVLKEGLPYLARDIPLAVTSDEPRGGDPSAEQLLSELRVSLDFFAREHPSVTIGQLLLFGNPIRVEPWCQWLATQLACPVVAGTLPCKSEAGQVVSPAFLCGVGVAMRAIQPGRVTLDFLERARPQAGAPPGLSQLKQLSPEMLKALAKPVALQGSLALAALAVVAMCENQRLLATKQRLEQTAQSVPDVGWGLKDKSMPELQTVQKQLEARLSLLRKTIEQRVPVTEKLDALAKLLPDGMWLERVTYQGGRESVLTLEGACYLPDSGRELDLISDFIERVKQDPALLRGFSTARLGGITKVEEKETRIAYRKFKVLCELPQKL